MEFLLITLPVLILHGTADKATKPSGDRRLYDTAGATDKTLKLYEGHVHDLMVGNRRRRKRLERSPRTAAWFGWQGFLPRSDIWKKR